MNKIDAMIAPRALTAQEIAEVAAPHIAAYAVAHRAFTHAGFWMSADGAMTHAAEGALEGVVEEAVRSIGEWLADYETSGEPRFYRKASIKPAVTEICRAAARIMCEQSEAAGVQVIVSQLEDRDVALLGRLIAGN